MKEMISALYLLVHDARHDRLVHDLAPGGLRHGIDGGRFGVPAVAGALLILFRPHRQRLPELGRLLVLALHGPAAQHARAQVKPQTQQLLPLGKPHY